MIAQLAIGVFVTLLTISIQVGMIAALDVTVVRAHDWLRRPPHYLRTFVCLVATLFVLLTAHGLASWVWALAFLVLDIFDTLEEALYFSLVSFTTLGFGDILLPQEWRLLSGLSATNGLLAFGLSTAFMIDMLNEMQVLHQPRKHGVERQD